MYYIMVSAHMYIWWQNLSVQPSYLERSNFTGHQCEGKTIRKRVVLLRDNGQNTSSIFIRQLLGLAQRCGPSDLVPWDGDLTTEDWVLQRDNIWSHLAAKTLTDWIYAWKYHEKGKTYIYFFISRAGARGSSPSCPLHKRGSAFMPK